MESKKSSALRIGQKNKKLDISDNMGKMPPQAVELEEVVLGALMLEKDALTNVIDILKPESFYREAHEEIYKAIVQLFNNSEPVDLMTVTNQLRKNGKLEIVGGAYYITSLTSRVNSAANIEYHARIIAEQAIKRQLIKISREIQEDAYEDTTDVFDLLDKTEQELFDVTNSNIKKNYADMSSLMKQAFVELEERRNHTDGLTGVPTGFSALDRVTSGWQKSDMVIIAARPGMGKCLGKGTKVLMYDGSLKNVEDVKVGEKLMGDDSTPRTVQSLARGRERMYWVHQNSAISYRVNESHILSLKRSRNEGKHKKGDKLDICLREYLDKSDKFKSNYKGYKVPVEFEEKPVGINPYFLGLWLGDGHQYSSRITNVDEEISDFMQEYADELGLEMMTYQQEGKAQNLAITKGSRGKQKFYSIQAELRQLNLIQNKHIPEKYLINNQQNRLSLLAGIIDADGYYSSDYNVFEIVQKSEHLTNQVKFLCDTLGFRTSIRKKDASINGRKISDVYRIRISGNIDVIPTKISRKIARPRKSIKDWRSTGITIEYDKVDDYYGFEIDGNKRFLLEDMTVTHNTAFIVSALRNAAVDFKQPVAIFSLEMSSVQLVNRLISSEAELDSEKIKKGDLKDYEWQQLVHKTAALTEAPIFIDDTPALSILELRAKCRRLKQQHDIQLVVIDYLQLMSGDTSKSGGGSGNREQEIASISRSLKNIAKELNVPVIALSQLSRAVETRGGDKRPQLSDLRESGSIEQDADMVMFLYRPEYYGITEDENGMPTSNVGEVIIAKHRNGSLETVPLKFIGRFTKFSDLDAPGSDSGVPGYGTTFPSQAGVPSDFDDAPSAVTLPSRATGKDNPQDSDEAPF
jgi:replicative DNA helicase